MKLLLIRAAAIFLIGVGLLFGLPTPVKSAVISINMEMDGSGSTSWVLNGLAPGNNGSQVVSIKNIGSTPGKIDIWLSNIRWTAGRDGRADLDKYLRFNLIGNQLRSAISMPASVSSFPLEDTALNTLYINRLNPGESITLNWYWSFVETGSAQNDAQGDGLVFDINYGMTEVIESSGGGVGGGNIPVTTTTTTTTTSVPQPTSTPGGGTGSGDVISLIVPNTVEVQTGVTTAGLIAGELASSTPDSEFTISLAPGTTVNLSNENRPEQVDLTSLGKKPEKIVVTNPESTEIPPYPEGWVPVSKAYDINGVTRGVITGVRMDIPALLVIRYDETLLPDILDDLACFYYNYEVGWTQLKPPEGFIAEGPEVAAEVDHFSLFVVLAKPGQSPGKPPANIVIQKLTVSPPRIMVGQSSEVRVKVTNKGGMPGEYNVVLKMDGKIQKTQIVHLGPGQSTEIALILSPGQNGLYTLTAGPASGNLMVDPRVMPDVTETDYWWLLCIALGIATLILSVFRRKQIAAPAIVTSNTYGPNDYSTSVKKTDDASKQE